MVEPREFAALGQRAGESAVQLADAEEGHDAEKDALIDAKNAEKEAQQRWGANFVFFSYPRGEPRETASSVWLRRQQDRVKLQAQMEWKVHQGRQTLPHIQQWSGQPS